MSKMLKSFPVKVETEGPDTRRFVISTEDEDREGDVLLAHGVRLEHYRKNPTVLWAHDYYGLPIGRAHNVQPSTRSITADIEFAPHDFAQEVKRLVDHGFLRGCSVGFDPDNDAWEYRTTNIGEQGRTFKKWELLEISLCPVPMNPMALVSEAKSMGYRVDAIERAMNGTNKRRIVTIKGTGMTVDLDWLAGVVREETAKVVARFRGQMPKPSTAPSLFTSTKDGGPPVMQDADGKCRDAMGVVVPCGDFKPQPGGKRW